MLLPCVNSNAVDVPRTMHAFPIGLKAITLLSHECNTDSASGAHRTALRGTPHAHISQPYCVTHSPASQHISRRPKPSRANMHVSAWPPLQPHPPSSPPQRHHTLQQTTDSPSPGRQQTRARAPSRRTGGPRRAASSAQSPPPQPTPHQFSQPQYSLPQYIQAYSGTSESRPGSPALVVQTRRQKSHGGSVKPLPTWPTGGPRPEAAPRVHGSAHPCMHVNMRRAPAVPPVPPPMRGTSTAPDSCSRRSRRCRTRRHAQRSAAWPCMDSHHARRLVARPVT